jgi:hypothetical protein
MYQKSRRKPKKSPFIMTGDLPDNHSVTVFGEMDLKDNDDHKYMFISHNI